MSKASARRVARRHTAVRLGCEAYDRVEVMAATETEGNVSQMLRKLLGEALRARESRSSR